MTGQKGKQPRRGLDSKDLSILTALGQLGGKVSAEELAEITHYNSRTIRHRLQRLRKHGYLAQLYAQTHEYRLGRGDAIVVLHETPSKNVHLKEILASMPWFYYYGPTYGRYNGYISHAMYSLDEPDSIHRIAHELIDLGIINDYYFFDTTDYDSRRGNFKYFEYNKGWIWDWSAWIQNVEERLQKDETPHIPLDQNPQRISFDMIDLDILRELKVESNRTLKELGAIVNLSETQVKRRITRLEEEGIIKAYRWVIKKIELPLYLYVFIEFESSAEKIIAAFYELPFPCEIVMETPMRYCVRIRLYGNEIPSLLRGLTHIRNYAKTFFVQFAHDISDIPAELSDRFFNESKGSWDYPIDETISKLRKKYG